MTLAPSIYRSPGQSPRVGLTVEQYHRMIETGILREGDPIELLEGELVRKDRSAVGGDPMTVGNRHALAIGILTELNARLTSRASYMRIQLPITVVPDSEPEPDGCIVRGAPKTYRDGHPEAKDICCVIEAAESSLAEDRGRKQRIYANAGIRQYVILNLVDNVVEEYTQPEVDRGRYAKVIPFSIGQQIELQTATQPLVVSISELLG